MIQNVDGSGLLTTKQGTALAEDSENFGYD